LIQLNIDFRQPRMIGIRARLVREQAMLLCVRGWIDLRMG
jgi:hypothetical protein